MVGAVAAVRRLLWRALGLADVSFQLEAAVRELRAATDAQVEATTAHVSVVNSQMRVAETQAKLAHPGGGWKPLIVCALMLALSSAGVFFAADALSSFDDGSNLASNLRSEAGSIEMGAVNEVQTANDSAYIRGLFALQALETDALSNGDLVDLLLRLEAADGDEAELARIREEVQQDGTVSEDLTNIISDSFSSLLDGSQLERSQQALDLALDLRAQAAKLEEGARRGRAQASALLAVFSAVLGAVLGWLVTTLLDRWPHRDDGEQGLLRRALTRVLPRLRT